MNNKQALHQIKVNLPHSEEDYKNGNGEGVWVEVDEKTFAAYNDNKSGEKHVGKLINQPLDDFGDYGLQFGDYFEFELRGALRPVATWEQDAQNVAAYLNVI